MRTEHSQKDKNNYSNIQKYKCNNPAVKFLLHRFLDKIVAIVIALDAKRILDAGCGEGAVIQRIKRSDKDIYVEGIDVSRDSLEAASKANPSVPFKIGDINGLDYPENSFDLVIALEVLEHLEDPAKAISEMKRVTKRHILVSIPHEPFFRIGNLLRGKYMRTLGNHPEHRQHWSMKGFKAFLKEGFRDVRVVSSFPWLIAIGKK